MNINSLLAQSGYSGLSQVSRQTLDIREMNSEESLNVLYQENDASLAMTVNRSVSYREVTYTAEGLMSSESYQPSSSATTQELIDSAEAMLAENATDNRPKIISAEIARLFTELYGEGTTSRTSPKYLYDQDTGAKPYGVMFSYRELVVEETIQIDAIVPTGDIYSPESTAQRIIDFAFSFYAGGDREEYAEMVRDAVMDGYEQAQAALGMLPSESTDTINIVMDAIDQFAANSPVNTLA